MPKYTIAKQHEKAIASMHARANKLAQKFGSEISDRASKTYGGPNPKAVIFATKHGLTSTDGHAMVAWRSLEPHIDQTQLGNGAQACPAYGDGIDRYSFAECANPKTYVRISLSAKRLAEIAAAISHHDDLPVTLWVPRDHMSPIGISTEHADALLMPCADYAPIRKS